MPCTYDESIPDCESTKGELDKLTRMLCDVCAKLEANSPSTFRSRVSLETQEWWANHKETDRLRQLEEEKARAIISKRKLALKKLTPEEKRILGL